MNSFSIFDSMLDGVVIIDLKSVLVYCNESFATIMQFSARRVLNKEADKVFILNPHFLEPIKAVINGKEMAPYVEISIKVENGLDKKVQTSAQRMGDHVLVYVRDTSLEYALYDKYRSEFVQREGLILQLHRKVFELEFLLSCAALGTSTGHITKASVMSKVTEALEADVICTYTVVEGTQGGWDFTSEEFYLLDDKKEFELRDIISRDIERWRSSDILKIFEEKSYFVDHSEASTVTCAVRTKAGDIHFYSYYFLTNKDAAEENAKLLDSVTKQTSMLIENQDLFIQSITDEKTKLYNQRYFNLRFEQEVSRSRRYNHQFALFVFDIDHFKKFNDTYGHLVGDQVLIEVAKVIKNSFRTTDITSRFGGEEFVVLVVETRVEHALDLANRVREAIKNNIVTTADGQNLTVTVSIGVAYFPTHGASPTELFEAADQALYRAKANGRNRVELAIVKEAK